MTTFITGDPPKYFGIPLTDEKSILSEIKKGLLLESFQVVYDNIDSESWFTVRGDNGNNYCWFRISSVNQEIFLQGDHDGENTILSSPSSAGTITPGSENNLYLCLENDFLSVSILDTFKDSQKGSFVGFPQFKLFPHDPFAWYSGPIHAIASVLAESSKNHISGIPWQSWSINAYDASVERWLTSALSTFAPQGTFDRYTVALKPYSVYTSESNRNAGSYAHNGALNIVDENAVLGDFFLIEPRANHTDYATQEYLGDKVPKRLPIKGFYNNICVGMSYYNKQTFVHLEDGRVFMSVGDRGYQGMRVA